MKYNNGTQEALAVYAMYEVDRQGKPIIYTSPTFHVWTDLHGLRAAYRAGVQMGSGADTVVLESIKYNPTRSVVFDIGGKTKKIHCLSSIYMDMVSSVASVHAFLEIFPEYNMHMFADFLRTHPSRAHDIAEVVGDIYSDALPGEIDGSLKSTLYFDGETPENVTVNYDDSGTSHAFPEKPPTSATYYRVANQTGTAYEPELVVPFGDDYDGDVSARVMTSAFRDEIDKTIADGLDDVCDNSQTTETRFSDIVKF